MRVQSPLCASYIHKKSLCYKMIIAYTEYLAIAHRLFMVSGPRLCCKLTKSITCFCFVRIVSISIPPSGFCWLVISPPLLLVKTIIACALIIVNILNFTISLQIISSLSCVYGKILILYRTVMVDRK